MTTRKPSSTYEEFESSSVQRRRLLRQEELILAITEAISELLEETGVSRADLARRLGKSKGFVSQILAGDRNLTLRTIADVFDALGHALSIEARPIGQRYGEDARRLRMTLGLLQEWLSASRAPDASTWAIQVHSGTRSEEGSQEPTGAA